MFKIRLTWPFNLYHRFILLDWMCWAIKHSRISPKCVCRLCGEIFHFSIDLFYFPHAVPSLETGFLFLALVFARFLLSVGHVKTDQGSDKTSWSDPEICFPSLSCYIIIKSIHFLFSYLSSLFCTVVFFYSHGFFFSSFFYAVKVEGKVVTYILAFWDVLTYRELKLVKTLLFLLFLFYFLDQFYKFMWAVVYLDY